MKHLLLLLLLTHTAFSTWYQVPLSGNPPSFRQRTLTVDLHDLNLVAFWGGIDQHDDDLFELWFLHTDWSLTPGTESSKFWLQYPSAGTLPPSGGFLWYHKSQLIQFGGELNNAPSTDIYIWSFESLSWRSTPAQGQQLPLRAVLSSSQFSLNDHEFAIVLTLPALTSPYLPTPTSALWLFDFETLTFYEVKTLSDIELEVGRRGANMVVQSIVETSPHVFTLRAVVVSHDFHTWIATVEIDLSNDSLPTVYSLYENITDIITGAPTRISDSYFSLIKSFSSLEDGI
ncbi:hypothetical protein GEMRC1_012985 [Eukaryota sp. GEM-RC1]